MFEGYFEKILEKCLKGILPRYWTDGGGGRERYWRGSKSQRGGGGRVEKNPQASYDSTLSHTE